MKRIVFPLVFAALAIGINAQNRAVKPRQKAPSNRPNAEKGIVVDERLAVLRSSPSLSAKPLRRIRRGGILTLLEIKSAEGVVFVRVLASSKTSGWIQRDAIVRRSSKHDDERLARLVLASDGFERIERAQIYLSTFPDSSFRPAMLLLVGDLLEETAMKLSSEATRRLNKREMAASGAPLRSFYLNYPKLDRYQKLGFGFVFNPETLRFHYDGAAWREIVKRFPGSNEASEATRRLGDLAEKMAAAN